MGLAVMDGVRQWSFTTAASPSLHERSSVKKKRRGVATFPPPPFSGAVAASSANTVRGHRGRYFINLPSLPLRLRGCFQGLGSVFMDLG